MEGNLIVVLLSSLLLTNTVKDQNEFIKYGGFVVAIACLCITFLNGGLLSKHSKSNLISP